MNTNNINNTTTAITKVSAMAGDMTFVPMQINPTTAPATKTAAEDQPTVMLNRHVYNVDTIQDRLQAGGGTRTASTAAEAEIEERVAMANLDGFMEGSTNPDMLAEDKKFQSNIDSGKGAWSV